MSPRNREQNEQMRAETLEKITRAAMKVFSEYGYHGATMNQISKAAGLSYGLVYHYFASKEAVFRHLVDVALDASISTINPAMDVPGTAWEKLENLSKVLAKEALRGDASLYFIIMIQALTQGRSIPGLLDHIHERSAAHYMKIIPLLMEAQKSGEAAQGDPHVLAATYFAFIQGLALLVSQEEGVREKITPDMLTNLLRSRG